MKKFSVILFLWIFYAFVTSSQPAQPYSFPSFSGYHTLLCDFHIHTVFSDGLVWPTIRVDEALREGLDAIAITDHLEYTPHDKDIPAIDFNRSFEIAAEYGEKNGLIVIHGSEITRDMPPGHMNALYLSNSNALKKDDPLEAIREARKQGAWIFWNHPMWTAQKPDGMAELTPLHKQLLKENLVDGIEVVNDYNFSDEAFEIALRHNLTILANSDIHGIVEWSFPTPQTGHRPITLVFASEKSADAIREALENHRTVIWHAHLLAGAQEFLEPLIKASLVVESAVYEPKTSVVSVTLSNKSCQDLFIENTGKLTLHNTGPFFKIKAGDKYVLEVKTILKRNQFELPLRILNAYIAPGKNLQLSYLISPEK